MWIANIRRHPSGPISPRGTSSYTPAALIRYSTGPSCSSVRATASSTAYASRTSSSNETSASAAAWISTLATARPSCRSLLAVAAPSPEAAPVMSATPATSAEAGPLRPVERDEHRQRHERPHQPGQVREVQEVLGARARVPRHADRGPCGHHPRDQRDRAGPVHPAGAPVGALRTAVRRNRVDVPVPAPRVVDPDHAPRPDPDDRVDDDVVDRGQEGLVEEEHVDEADRGQDRVDDHRVIALDRQ